jgi:hypothetical protein
MTIKSLIATLILGSSSLAMAQPYGSGRVMRDHRSADNRDDERDASVYTGPIRTRPVVPENDTTWYGGRRTYRPTWVSLTEPTRIERGRERIFVGAQAGRFTQLRLQASAGTTYLERVVVKFNDGTLQDVRLARVIDSRDPIAQFELDRDRRRIDRIVVYGDTAPGSSYQVFGI